MKTLATDRAQITAAIAKFDPAVARMIRAVRAVLIDRERQRVDRGVSAFRRFAGNNA